jgi:hypothetical protein
MRPAGIEPTFVEALVLTGQAVLPSQSRRPPTAGNSVLVASVIALRRELTNCSVSDATLAPGDTRKLLHNRGAAASRTLTSMTRVSATR